MGKLGPFLTLVFLIVLTDSSNAVRRTIKFTGTGNLQSHVACTDEFQELGLTLSCGTKQLLHIEALTISDSVICGNKKNYSCEISQARDFRVFCETEYGGCTHTVRSHHLCPSPNRIHVSFQCIDAKIVHDMCPSEPTTRNHHEPAYYITPRFTHMSYVQCECRVSVEHFIVVKVLYLDLKKSSNGACLDYISFQDGAKYCNLTGRREQPIKRTLYPGKSWWFESDGSITSRGGWLKLSSTNGNPFQITCTQNIPTTSWWTSTESQESEHSSKVGGIVGGVIGVVVGMIVVIIIVVVGSQKITRRPRPNRHVMTYHSQPRSCTQNDAPVSGSSTFSPDGQTDSNAPLGGRADPNAPPPDYSTLPPDVTAKGQLDIYPPPYTAGPL